MKSLLSEDRVLEVARTLPQPFLAFDVWRALATQERPESVAVVFHLLRDLYDQGRVKWSEWEGYTVA